MLYRIFFQNRWIPVNLPDNDYSESFLADLTDRLSSKLVQFPGDRSMDWNTLQTIELAVCNEGWEATLYFDTDIEREESFIFR
ncbi:hypothetical protein EBB07_08695 [Paenibacillaceae bacterium]|nr:hypothetical protein EBB07_08695 [Paenibacillaceae bacterium]